jgi:hypothetical protein
MGVRPDGTKELIAVEDGYRESTESWGAVLRDLRRRGMRAPVLAVGDGALGFWAALRDVWPETREQRDWVHRIINCWTSCRSGCSLSKVGAPGDHAGPFTGGGGEGHCRLRRGVRREVPEGGRNAEA